MFYVNAGGNTLNKDGIAKTGERGLLHFHSVCYKTPNFTAFTMPFELGSQAKLMSLCRRHKKKIMAYFWITWLRVNLNGQLKADVGGV